MRIFQNLNVNFLGKRKLFYTFSAVLFLIGLVNFLIRGLQFGIDFQGGSEIIIEFDKPVDVTDIRGKVENIGLGNVEIKTFGSETGVLLRTDLKDLPRNIYKQVATNLNKTIETEFPGLQYQIQDSSSVSSITYSIANTDTLNTVIDKLFEKGYQAGRSDVNVNQIAVRIGISDWLKQNLRSKMPDNNFKILREQVIGPKVGKELKYQASVAIFLSLLVILIYLAFRYKFIFGFGAVVALFHDTLITLGLYAALYNVIPGLNLEIDLTIVAAFLTLIGYSINDTVVVFDRVRENLKLHKGQPLEKVINDSINQTMSRTILTGGTSLMTLAILIIFGGEVLRAFSFTLFFGIVIGTYSSIFVASALVLEYANRRKSKVEF